jgi:hypothetical protein
VKKSFLGRVLEDITETDPREFLKEKDGHRGTDGQKKRREG